MVVHNTFADFVLFLYVHVAHSDGEYHPSEQKVILEKVPKLFPAGSDPKEILSQAEEQYLRTDHGMIATIIRDTFHHFRSVKFSQKYKIYTDMYDIIHADGKVEESETRALNELKEIIEMGATSRT